MPKGFEVVEGLKLTQDYKVLSMKAQAAAQSNASSILAAGDRRCKIKSHKSRSCKQKAVPFLALCQDIPACAYRLAKSLAVVIRELSMSSWMARAKTVVKFSRSVSKVQLGPPWCSCLV